MEALRIYRTTNYRLFQRHGSENRPVDLKKHKRLVDAMKLYGFIPCYPIIVQRSSTGFLIVKDGQHRLMIAESLDLPIYYVEDKTGFDVAIVNSTPKVWVLRDYAQKFATGGSEEYANGLQFAAQHGLPIGTAFALLSGTTTFGNVQDAFVSGSWRAKDVQWANAVAGIYVPLVKMSPAIRNQRFIEACMAVCRVTDFDAARLLSNAERCREKLVAYSTREAYLDMLEAVYNYGRKHLVGLKAEATMAMKARNSIEVKKAKKQALRVAAA